MIDKRLIWFKDAIIPLTKAKINVLSPTSQFGLNVFEGIRCYWNEKDKQLYAFRLEEHLSRLINSAKKLKISNKYDLDFLKNAFIDTIRANNYKEDIAIRQTLFVDGFGTWHSKEPVEMFIAPIPKNRTIEKKGLTCLISSWERINEKSISPKIKCGANYINSRMAHLEAVEKGYDTAILLNNKGFVSEGPGSCLFIIKDKMLITPPLTASILDSITRKTILDFAKNYLNINVEERNITKEELYNCEEAFLCGSAMEITPIITIDKYDVVPGKITKEISKTYLEIVTGNINKYKKWLTPIY